MPRLALRQARGWSKNWAVLALTVLSVTGIGILGGHATVHADDGCDTSEQVACIPLPSDTTPSPPQPNGGSNSAASAGSAAPAAAAVALPFNPTCAQGSCCPLPAIAAQPPDAAIAVPISNPCPPYPCYPPIPGVASSGNAVAVPVPPVPAPQPVYCSPYRGIYTTINLGNAADVRALRTLSSAPLRPYWQGAALSVITGQIRQLLAVGDFATPSLQSIQVQSATLDLLSSSASVRTLEHWLYQERSSFDGSLVSSQDQWVSNSYTLSSSPSGWYISDDQISVVPGP